MVATGHRLIVLLVLAAIAQGEGGGKEAPRRPFYDARLQEPTYAGPGREEKAPVDLKDVRIGYFGPATTAHPEGGDMWCAALMAVEQANKAGGCQGIPFRLVPGWSENPWGSGVTEVARMAYVHRVWAIIGGIDGPSTHLAEQVVAKARLALINPVATDKTVNLANVPWMFSCVPQDHAQAEVLAGALAAHVRKKPFVVLSAVDHDSHVFVVELLRALAAHELVPSRHFEFAPRLSEHERMLDDVVAAEPAAIALIADARSSAQMVSGIRKSGYDGPVFGGPWMGSRAFAEQAGEAADGVIFPNLYDRAPRTVTFEQQFTERFARAPDYRAAHTYDAVNLLIAAIRKAGLNRARICDAIREAVPWPGVGGRIRWSPTGANSRPVGLATIVGTAVQPLPAATCPSSH